MVILIDVKKKKGTSDLRHKLLRKLVVHFIFLIKCSLEVSSKMVKKIVELISQLIAIRNGNWQYQRAMPMGIGNGQCQWAMAMGYGKRAMSIGDRKWANSMKGN